MEKTHQGKSETNPVGPTKENVRLSSSCEEGQMFFHSHKAEEVVVKEFTFHTQTLMTC